MRLLLDTHVVLWQLEGSRTLRPAAHSAIEQATELSFSVVSFAEIGAKAAVGKLSGLTTFATTSSAAACGFSASPSITASGSPISR